MAPRKITVVISQGQSQNPAKRDLEESIVAALLMEPGIEVTIIPHLYDLTPDGTGMLCLQGIAGHMVVLAWLFPRAAHWTLDRNGIRGLMGTTLLGAEEEDDEDEEDSASAAENGDGEAADAEAEEKHRVIDSRPQPGRKIYCVDLRASNKADDFVAEIRRIADEVTTKVVDLMGWIGGSPQPGQLARFQNPTNDTALGGNGNGHPRAPVDSPAAADGANQPQRVEETPARRWYPVIDYSRCTNCMECIDFCLFGVYGVDGVETILVEQPDNCRKGCPACSRVCPENAIIFPQHKTPGIAGSNEAAGTLKIDLSQLFGAPKDEDPMVVAARERDEQLLLAGRDAVGMSVGMPKRQADKPAGPKDDLDHLLDKLDDLDL